MLWLGALTTRPVKRSISPIPATQEGEARSLFRGASTFTARRSVEERPVLESRLSSSSACDSIKPPGNVSNTVNNSTSHAWRLSVLLTGFPDVPAPLGQGNFIFNLLTLFRWLERGPSSRGDHI